MNHLLICWLLLTDVDVFVSMCLWIQLNEWLPSTSTSIKCSRKGVIDPHSHTSQTRSMSESVCRRCPLSSLAPCQEYLVEKESLCFLPVIVWFLGFIQGTTTDSEQTYGSHDPNYIFHLLFWSKIVVWLVPFSLWAQTSRPESWESQTVQSQWLPSASSV